MSKALNAYEPPMCTANRIVLTQELLQIPGIRTFGWQRDISATSPLQDHFHEDALELTFIVNGSSPRDYINTKK
ncbi:MAG: hypothetical protein IJ390_02445 [Lachnospiraceae bacterium]|nr:hypothetical protein [Lachnospiraceae bacterium]